MKCIRVHRCASDSEMAMRFALILLVDELIQQSLTTRRFLYRCDLTRENIITRITIENIRVISRITVIPLMMIIRRITSTPPHICG